MPLETRGRGGAECFFSSFLGGGAADAQCMRVRLLKWSFSSKSAAACEITGESISIQVQKPKSTD